MSGKEELKAKLIETHRCTAITGIMLMEKIIDELYVNNVIIPRGENPHPDADVIHAMAEGTKCERNEPIIGWQSCNFDYAARYRIKPTELIYEWQWTLYYAYIGEVARPKFMTTTEYECMAPELKYFMRDESTKRERK